MIKNDSELRVMLERVAALERLLQTLRPTARPEEWTALSSGYRRAGQLRPERLVKRCAKRADALVEEEPHCPFRHRSEEVTVTLQERPHVVGDHARHEIQQHHWRIDGLSVCAQRR